MNIVVTPVGTTYEPSDTVKFYTIRTLNHAGVKTIYKHMANGYAHSEYERLALLVPTVYKGIVLTNRIGETLKTKGEFAGLVEA